MRLAGRSAIVTGAGSGIGRASAVLFAKEGAFVGLVDRDRVGLQETLAAIEGANGEASQHVGDVALGEARLAAQIFDDAGEALRQIVQHEWFTRDSVEFAKSKTS